MRNGFEGGGEGEVLAYLDVAAGGGDSVAPLVEGIAGLRRCGEGYAGTFAEGATAGYCALLGVGAGDADGVLAGGVGAASRAAAIGVGGGDVLGVVVELGEGEAAEGGGGGGACLEGGLEFVGEGGLLGGVLEGGRGLCLGDLELGLVGEFLLAVGLLVEVALAAFADLEGLASACGHFLEGDGGCVSVFVLEAVLALDVLEDGVENYSFAHSVLCGF